jgi:hypothetical protein
VIGSVLTITFAACTTNDLQAVPIPPPVLCDTPTCIERVPLAAIAVERTTGSDGGPCSAGPLKFSLPEGDDAFDSISSCGGNKIRCGNADYRISSSDLSFDCTVSGQSPVHVKSRIETVSGIRFSVDGTVTPDRGTVTISASAGADGASVDPTECHVAPNAYLARGSIWADFDCNPDADGSSCHLRGTFVFENCNTGADGGG